MLIQLRSDAIERRICRLIIGEVRHAQYRPHMYCAQLLYVRQEGPTSSSDMKCVEAKIFTTCHVHADSGCVGDISDQWRCERGLGHAVIWAVSVARGQQLAVVGDDASVYVPAKAARLSDCGTWSQARVCGASKVL